MKKTLCILLLLCTTLFSADFGIGIDIKTLFLTVKNSGTSEIDSNNNISTPVSSDDNIQDLIKYLPELYFTINFEKLRIEPYLGMYMDFFNNNSVRFRLGLGVFALKDFHEKANIFYGLKFRQSMMLESLDNSNLYVSTPTLSVGSEVVLGNHFAFGFLIDINFNIAYKVNYSRLLTNIDFPIFLKAYF